MPSFKLPTREVIGRALPLDRSRLIFPSNLVGSPLGQRVLIRFACKPSKNDPALITITFPCPNGLNFSDRGNYDSIELGAIGTISAAGITGAINGVKDALNAGGGAAGALKSGGIGAIQGMIESIAQAGPFDLARIAASAIPGGGNLTEQLSFGARTVSNPNTHTTFKNNTNRAFQFNFNLIPNSPEESEVALKIHDSFRQYVYAEKDSPFSLKYPPTWEIQFIYGPDATSDNSGQECPFIPKIHKCFLEGVESTFNNTNSAWRVDGAPLEINMALSFSEVKILTREDILELQKPQPNRDYAPEETAQEVNTAAKATLDDLKKFAIGKVKEFKRGPLFGPNPQ